MQPARSNFEAEGERDEWLERLSPKRRWRSCSARDHTAGNSPSSKQRLASNTICPASTRERRLLAPCRHDGVGARFPSNARPTILTKQNAVRANAAIRPTSQRPRRANSDEESAGVADLEQRLQREPFTDKTVERRKARNRHRTDQKSTPVQGQMRSKPPR